MLQFELPWAFALLPLPLMVYWLTPEFRDRVPDFVAARLGLTHYDRADTGLDRALGQKPVPR